MNINVEPYLAMVKYHNFIVSKELKVADHWNHANPFLLIKFYLEY